MCGGLSCAVDGCHGNSNKLRYSFKILVLRNRKSVMSGAVRMACSTKVKVSTRVHSAARSLVHVCCVCVVLHAVRVFIGCVNTCYVLCCVARSSCFSLAACFHVVVSCVNTRLMSILISCVFVSCFAHGW